MDNAFFTKLCRYIIELSGVITTFISSGGLGGLALEMVNWMVKKGAKHFVLTSRSGKIYIKTSSFIGLFHFTTSPKMNNWVLLVFIS